ncbi:MAG: CCA tRNA nucleotidyltransferase [Thermoleophilaceae bacterium]
MTVEALDSAKPIQAVRDALAASEESAWIVGGSVRDALLGRRLKDVDVSVAGDPERAAKAIGAVVRGPVFQLSGEFGAWRAVSGGGAWVADVSRLQGDTIEQDLAQRDFSVNAMAVPLEGGELLDPHGGQADLDAGILRALPGAYEADPLRPLRMVRFATELALTPDPKTERATSEYAPRVVEAAPERVFAELRHVMAADRVLDGLELADQLGLIESILPEVAALHGIEQSHFHHLDVYGHTMEVLREQVRLERDLDQVLGDELTPRLRSVLEQPLGDELTRSQALRWAALLHDIGKAPTRAIQPGGRVTFIGHDAVGAEMVAGVCRRLRTSERLREYLANITRHHLVLGFMVHQRPLTRAAAYRYLTTTSPVEIEVTLLTCADRLATRGKNAEQAIALHLELARELMGYALDWRESGPPKVPVRGDELASELGIQRGPEIGRLLAQLEEARFTGEIETREQAIELARRLRQNPAA